MHHSHMCVKSPVFTNILRAKWSLPHRSCTPLKRWQSLAWATRRLRPRWLPQSTTKRWLQRLRSEGEMVPHNVGRPRSEEAGFVSPRLASVVSHLSNYLCVIWAFSGDAHEGGPLASEAGDTLANMVLCIFSTYRPPLYVKNQHLTALNKRRHLELCTSMLQSLGEAKRPHSGISRARHTFFLKFWGLSCPSSIPLCTRSSRRSSL